MCSTSLAQRTLRDSYFLEKYESPDAAVYGGSLSVSLSLYTDCIKGHALYGHEKLCMCVCVCVSMALVAGSARSIPFLNMGKLLFSLFSIPPFSVDLCDFIFHHTDTELK